MEKHLFSVYDSAAAMYLDPFVAPTVEFAMREFRRMANTPGQQIATYPADYTLFHIGAFDCASGDLIGCPPRSLGVAITFVEQRELLQEDTDG